MLAGHYMRLIGGWAGLMSDLEVRAGSSGQLVLRL